MINLGRGKRASAIGILVYLGGINLFGYDIMPLLPYFMPLVAYLFGADVYQEKVKNVSPLVLKDPVG